MGFLKGVLKVSAAIVLSIVALAILGGIATWVYEAHKKRDAAPYEQVKLFRRDLTDPLQMKLAGRTKLVEQQFYADFNFQGYPSYLTNSPNQAPEFQGGIAFIFLDRDGFKVHEKFVKLREFTSIHERGVRSGLTYEFNEYMPVETYRRIENVTVTWTLSLEAPGAVPPVPRDAEYLADYCAPNLSKAERLKRLGKLGKVRQTGMGEYTVGVHVVHYLGGGDELYNCR